MKYNIEFAKDDLEGMMVEKLGGRRFQLPAGKKFEWRFRPTLHVLATVESLEITDDSEVLMRSSLVSRMRDMMLELHTLQKYGHVIRSLEKAVFQLEHAEQDARDGVVHDPIIADDDIPAMLPASAKKVVEGDSPEEFASEMDKIIAQSRHLLAGESRHDPRA